MSIAIEDDHLALLDTARRFTGQHCTSAVARAALEAPGDEEEQLPPFWDLLAGLGWLGLAVPEALGGEGYGYAELAVVLEELGRSIAPGPALPTAWAAAVLAAAGSGDLAPEVATGRAVGTVALGSTLVVDSTLVVATGAIRPVLCGTLATVVIAPALVDGAEVWVALRAGDGVRSAAVESLDPTRRVASLEVDGAPVTILAGVIRAQVEAVGVCLAAAEAAGGAAWCVDTAATYAKDRRQFGRPIGQFQAVKHRCADMLVRLEQVRSVAWDAARALDDPGPGSDITVAAAGAIALDGYVDVAKDCIQVLGGIGFTWEHDAHLHLRRALVLRQLLSGAGPWRRSLAGAALAGARRALALDLPADAQALREEIAAAVDAIAALAKDERRVPLADAGLLVPHWAPPWGRDASAVEQVVIDQELRRAKVRAPHLQVGAWAAPTIAVHGTVEQQERWVRPTLHGEIAWCQLFSEPEAGSDLAALTTAATKVDGGWLLNGQKVWTSMAKEADWGICLARTNPQAAKHLGITYFIVDMRSPGIDIRPLREFTGMEMLNEVFLEDVLVPDDCVIGEVDGGWPLARTTLANERVSMGSGSSFGGGIEQLVALVAQRVDDGLLDPYDPLLLDGLGALVAEAHSVAVLGLRTAVRSVTGAAPGSEASVRKLLGVEHDQRTQEAGLELLGPDGTMVAGAGGQWSFGFLANRCLTIAGGTSEVQRNVIGERLLGLPEGPRAEMADTVPEALRTLDVEQPGFYLRPDYHELLGWLRAHDPVHRSANGMVLVSRYEDIRDISRQPHRFTSRRGALVNDPMRALEPNDAAGSLLHLDPPLHADYRRLLNREFTPTAVARMDATVRRIVQEAFDDLAALPDGEVDLVEHVALPVPVRVIAEFLGMGDQPLADVRRWSDATIAVTDDQSPAVMEAVTEFAVFLDAHVRGYFERASSGTPDDGDLLSLLASSVVGDQPLTQAQVQLFCMTLMVAGNETTRSLVSGGALALAEHPEQRAALALALTERPDDPATDAAMASTVEEALRWVTPIQAFCRTAIDDGELAGGEVRSGDYLVMLYASGNRDEAVFGPTAHRFDVGRPATPAHVAFGFGEHLCLGASLARLEARLVFEELLRRHPGYAVAGAPVFVASTLTSSLDSLPVRLDPSAEDP